MSINQIVQHLVMRLGGASVGTTGKLNKNGKPKKESTRKGKPTCNGDFTKKICAEQKSAIDDYKKANPGKNHMGYVSVYKKEHEGEWNAYQATWKEEHPKDDHGSVSDAGSSASKPKKTLTPEHLAAMKAGREAAKAKKDAEKSSSENASVATSTETAGNANKAKNAKKAKKAKKAEPIIEPVAVISSSNSIAEDDGPEHIPFKHGGVTYMRIGNKREDGTYLWSTGDLWANKKGVKGDYVGCLQDDGSVDTDALEPLLE